MKKWFPWILTGLFAAWFLSGMQEPKPVQDYDLAGWSRLPVLLNGRIQPLDSVARNCLLSISGKSLVRVKGSNSLSAAEWLLETTTRPQLADTRKFFRVQHPDLEGLLGTEKASLEYYSFNDVTNQLESIENQARTLMDSEQAKGSDAEKLRTPFQKDLMHLYESLVLYTRLKDSLIADDNAYFRAIPPAPGQPADAWLTIFDSNKSSAEAQPAIAFYADMAAANQNRQPVDFNRAAASYRIWLQNNNLAPQLAHSSREYFFNQIEPFYKSMVIYVAAAIFGCIYWINFSETMRRSGFKLLVLAFIIHTIGLGYRMYLEGRPPVTNLYSSAIFIGWGATLLGIILERIFKGGIGLVSAGFIGFTTLIIAHHLALSGDTMEMLRAVLDTNLWLATHVVVITMGYASMFVAGLLAIIYVLRGFFTRSLSPDIAKALVRMVYGIVCFATLFSFAGTILGGIWADQSWGRFWGWDPKENGALLIVLWNAIILHLRWGGMIKDRGLMISAIFGNIITSFSWFGVNMLGVGLHSYGFMDQAFTWLMIFDASQVLLIGLALVPVKYWKSLTLRQAYSPALPSLPS